jgi:hypothetical protein
MAYSREGSALSLEAALFVVPYVCVTCEITRVQAILSSVCSLIPSCVVVNNCGETVMCVVCVVCVVSCVGISLLPAVGNCGFLC